VNIDRSISLIAPTGIYGGITVFTGDGVLINTAGVDVTLKGLTINGMGGAQGVSFIHGASLRIQDSAISSLTANGVNAVAPNSKVFVTNTALRQNQGSAVYLEGTVTAVIDGVRAESNGYGIYARSGPSVEVRNSTAADNANGGFTGEAASATTSMMVSNSSALRNANGIHMIVIAGQMLNMTVLDSVLEGNAYCGITDNGASGGSNLVVENSKIIRNGIGHYFAAGIAFGSTAGGDARKATLLRNLISGHTDGYGVLLSGVANTVVMFSGNMVTHNYGGIYTLYGPGYAYATRYSRGDNTVGNNIAYDISSNTSAAIAMTPLAGF
jgi:hypothetical protein